MRLAYEMKKTHACAIKFYLFLYDSLTLSCREPPIKHMAIDHDVTGIIAMYLWLGVLLILL